MVKQIIQPKLVPLHGAAEAQSILLLSHTQQINGQAGFRNSISCFPVQLSNLTLGSSGSNASMMETDFWRC